MALYAYVCPQHGEFESVMRADAVVCLAGKDKGCTMLAKRRWVWKTPAPFQAHWNPQYGRVLNNRHEAHEHAKRQSDLQSEKLGMNINLEVTDALEYQAGGLRKEELDEARENTIKQGEREAAARRAAGTLAI